MDQGGEQPRVQAAGRKHFALGQHRNGIMAVQAFLMAGNDPEILNPGIPLQRLTEQPGRILDKNRICRVQFGKGLFIGAELVQDRETKEPVDEKLAQQVVAECGAQGVIIGVTNRSLPGRNNTLCFSPALIATADDIDAICDAVDKALTKVFG